METGQKKLKKNSASTYSCGRACTGRFIICQFRSIKAYSGQAVAVLCVTMVLLGKLLLICFFEESTLGLTSVED